MAENATEQDHKNFMNWLGGLFAINVVLAATFLVLYSQHFNGDITKDHTQWAEFGDFVGGSVGALVSLTGLLALLLTIGIQSKALRISKEELQLTRQEVAKASAAAEAQVQHFDSQAKIDDIVASIKEIEQEIKLRKDDTLVAYDEKYGDFLEIPLEAFLEKWPQSIAFLHPGFDLSSRSMFINSRNEELGHLFKLLFDQIMTLKTFPTATNRYRVFISKHLETFFCLSKADALPFEWKNSLDKESQQFLETYENTLAYFRLLLKEAP
ncbi:hypothetical protein SAMN05216429_102234 [Marinobacter persicus]|uniref:Phage abortive infection protein n=1 Tax=Marinobacter persicus TaxID=930118 RepID=A0A1I3R2U7_9GAMM|nr:hypothetical protein [Marinobacter persicus]GHD43453.1 hypothetical protein GCM10008110_07410 [Marinobacter persicus]SFJ40678.1 hypothetical protein SAMN05216429_102234 [Marinobacter persicus]